MMLGDLQRVLPSAEDRGGGSLWSVGFSLLKVAGSDSLYSPRTPQVSVLRPTGIGKTPFHR